ncbi:MAG: Na/Pi cotransporter family protein [Ruminococcaceae bacterium]|nr:Na/Pi cotransporter family protein [Oscillospiraceae bacterium]
MTFFDLLTMIGGLSLFLFGMTVMGNALERRAGSSLKNILEKITGNAFLGFLTGLGVTAVIQSSSATTVMVVGFVNSGLMTLRQAIGVIMGANVGTTVTAWILSLSGLSGNNPVIQMLKPTSFTPVLALIGIVFLMFGKSTKKKDTAMILLGFATLMFGMDTMSGAVEGLKDVPAFTKLFLLFENPLLGVLAGALLTAVLQSSSASVGILQALAATGKISYGSAIPIIMGQNIGTCVTSLLSSVGAKKNARRAALVHLSFNVIGTIILLIAYSVVRTAFSPAILHEGASLAGIAVCHSAFNAVCTVILFPCAGLLEKLSIRLIPDGEREEDVVELDERLLVTPAVALQRCHETVLDMARDSFKALKIALDAQNAYAPETEQAVRDAEERVDRYEDVLGSYLVKLSMKPLTETENRHVAKYLKMIGDFERISDHGVNIVEAAAEMQEKQIVFTPEGQKELSTISDAVSEIAELTLAALEKGDRTAADTIEPLEEIIDGLKEDLRTRHITRLQAGKCTIAAGFVWSDLLTDLERVSDHCSNVAGCLMEMERDEMDLHDALRKFRSESETYRKNLELYNEKYSLP